MLRLKECDLFAAVAILPSFTATHATCVRMGYQAELRSARRAGTPVAPLL